MSRYVAGLFGFDGSRAENRADGADIGDQVVTLGLVTLHEVRSIGERNRRIGLSYQERESGDIVQVLSGNSQPTTSVNLIPRTGVNLGVHVATVFPFLPHLRPVLRYIVCRQLNVGKYSVGTDVCVVHHTMHPQALNLGPGQDLTGPWAGCDNHICDVVENAGLRGIAVFIVDTPYIGFRVVILVTLAPSLISTPFCCANSAIAFVK